MNADASPGVSVRLSASAKVPLVHDIAVGLLIAGGVIGTGGHAAGGRPVPGPLARPPQTEHDQDGRDGEQAHATAEHTPADPAQVGDLGAGAHVHLHAG